MAAQSSQIEEEVSCIVCFDIYKNPIILKCSHSFCKACLEKYWKEKGSRECPLCRRKSPKGILIADLSLKNLCESFKRNKSQISRAGCAALCNLHRETLKLFCLEDEEPVCAKCVTSGKHANHAFCPAEKIAQDHKKELKSALELLQKKMEAFNVMKETYYETEEYIVIQAEKTERQIKEEFEKLYQFLHDEEVARIAALREEEEQKSRLMKEKIENIIRKISSLSNTIRALELDMCAEDISFLQNHKETKSRYVNSSPSSSSQTKATAALTPDYDCRAQCPLQDPEGVSGALIDVAKHLGSLKYRVWEKMLGIVQYTHVILDPNTAEPRLLLSEDLTSVRRSAERQQLPDNPERFEPHVCVLGSEGFNSGRHYWDIELGKRSFWWFGVAKESINRKGELTVSPEVGFWTLCLHEGVHIALTSPMTPLTVKRKPQKIRVQLDCDRGEVSFFDANDQEHIYTFIETFTERVFPVFLLGTDRVPLTICSLKVSITVQ